MAALMRAPRVVATAPTSGRALQCSTAVPLGVSNFHGTSLSIRQASRRQRILQVTHAGNSMFGGDDDDDGSGVATMEREERTEEYIAQWPNKQYIAETLEQFPDAGIASVEQARVLFSEGGYTYLDVRPALEFEDIGKVVGSVNIPLYVSTRKYDTEAKKKRVVKKDKVEDWIQKVEKRFPDKSVKLLIGCSNGTQYSIEALEALDEAGYENIVGLKGGFYSWFAVFDNKLGRRFFGEYAEQYTHDGDSCGIHSSGAGFDRVDKVEPWVPPEGY